MAKDPPERSAQPAPAVAVIIPARNEGERIAATVTAARRLPGVGQAIAVDDGSTDDTAGQAAAAGASVMRLERRIGKGGAVRAGLGAAQGEIVLLLDGDLGASAAEAHKLLAPVASGGADMAIAVLPRVPHRGGFGLAVGLARLAIQALAWRRMQAPLSGQRAVRRSLLERIRPASGFALETALSLDALALGARLVEVPTEMTHAATGRSLAGFLHRGRHFAAVLAAALPRLLWPVGPTGRPAGRARMVAWAVLMAALVACAWLLAPGALMGALALAWAACAVVGSVVVADRLSWERENYQGRSVASSVGICFAFAAVLSLAYGLWANPDMALGAALSLLMATVGLLDDLRGSREVRGFAGHFRGAVRGRITTGLVKVVVGGGACFAMGLHLSAWYLWPGLLNGALIALCANTINLLDLRPGRALKGFWALCLLAFAFNLPVPVIFGGLVVISSVIYAPLDFGARAMMGDAGSNVLGAVAGVALAAALPVGGRIAVVAVLAAIHIYAEFGSLSALIDRSSLLRWLDGLGRAREARPAAGHVSSPSMGED